VGSAEEEKMILLDTHTILWLAREPDKLSKIAAEAVRKARRTTGIAIAGISLWEIAWLAKRGRIDIHESLDSFVEDIASRTVVRPITPRIATLASLLSDKYSKDPCDRLIGATALAEGMALVTMDANIRRSGEVKTIW
jgi:PIN domain nuclease of toxin-antitoxin system